MKLQSLDEIQAEIDAGKPRISDVVRHMLETQENFQRYGHEETIEMVRDLEDRLAAAEAREKQLLQSGGRNWAYLENQVRDARIEELEWVLRDHRWTDGAEKALEEIQYRLKDYLAAQRS